MEKIISDAEGVVGVVNVITVKSAQVGIEMEAGKPKCNFIQVDTTKGKNLKFVDELNQITPDVFITELGIFN
ncbi:hypothetical protein RJG79_10800 [Mycoplasmatota bacterium WC44]